MCDAGTTAFEPPESVEVHAEEGLVEIPNEAIAEALPMEDGMTIYPDGSMDVQVPEGTEWNADAGSLTFPRSACGP